jgi:hypothetical protein
LRCEKGSGTLSERLIEFCSSRRRQVRNLEAANFKKLNSAFDVYIAFDANDAVTSLFLTETSRNPSTVQIREAFLRVIGELMALATENRDPLHSDPL